MADEEDKKASNKNFAISQSTIKSVRGKSQKSI